LHMKLHKRCALARCLVPAAFVLLATGCTSYSLQGKVIAGDISYVAVVDASDERLSGPGLVGASLALETDPGKLKREHVGDAVSSSDGSFSIRVNRPGAGLLIYDVGIRVQRNGYEGVQQIFRLPSSGKRVLVILRPGVDQLKEEEESLMEQFERFKQR
jgi:hypothetical protein